MKKLSILFEELWVAVAFAEAGEYNSLHAAQITARQAESIRMQAV
jgi:hypothetical protein